MRKFPVLLNERYFYIPTLHCVYFSWGDEVGEMFLAPTASKNCGVSRRLVKSALYCTILHMKLNIMS
jgi:hypothetical protein